MDDERSIRRLIDELSDPAAFPDGVDEVEVRQTHMSVVLLTENRAYKFKKPVDFGFVDYSTLERREHFCREEVRLNRRLAPDVYRGVVPVVRTGDGWRLDGDGEPVEWAVVMERLPEEATLESKLRRGRVGADVVRNIAERVADFHDDAEGGPEVAEFARFEAVAGNVRDNFQASLDQVGTTVHPDVFERARSRSEAVLEERRSLIDERAERGVPCDSHGDLRLDHVYLFLERDPPRDIEIIDCIEFNEAFRYGDPVADIAFLVMDLAAAGRRDLAETCAEAYIEASGDEEGRRLMDLYVSYRAAVRAKVEGLKATEEEVPREERQSARRTAAAHWLLAAERLLEPVERPGLVLVGGLPATGKSTLAAELARRFDFGVIDTDVVRKELVGLSPGEDASAAPGEGIYTEAWSERTYGACRVRAEQALYAGDRILVDATFHRADRRRAFLDLARDWGVPVAFLECRTPRSVVRDRIEARTEGPSDADWEVYEHLESEWEAAGNSTARIQYPVSTERSVDEAVAEAREALESVGLVSADE